MSIEESVDTGEVKARKGNGILRASAIGSCVVIAAYDRESGVGAMAHVMLPGSSQEQDSSKRTRYAEDAVEEMARKMAVLGAAANGMSVSLVGGANVLDDGQDGPGAEIVESLNRILRGYGVVPVATEVGGTQRRSCSLDVASGRVTCTVGDSGHRVLWEAKASTPPPRDSRGPAPDGLGET